MELLVFAAFGLIAVILLASWVWVMRTVAATTALLQEATRDTESIIAEVKQVSQEFAEVTNQLEQARLKELNSPKNRRSSDRQDN